MTPFPADFPKDEVKILIPILRGGIPVNKKELIRAAWVVIGYAADQVMKNDNSFVTTADAPANMTALTCAGVLEDCLRHRRVSAAAALPWADIMKILGPLIMQWLAGRFKIAKA